MKFGKKDKKDMTDNEKDAKISAVTAMRDMAAGMMGDKLSGMKKSTYKDGLSKGMDKAEDLISRGPNSLKHSAVENPEENQDGDDEESLETPEFESSEDESTEEGDHHPLDSTADDEMSEDEINSKLEKLMALKKKRSSK